MTQRSIVLDANILIRAVLGERVRQLITDHAAEVQFFAPDTAYAEAREHLPALLESAAGVARRRWIRWPHLKSWCVPLRPTCISIWSGRRWHASANATPTTGQRWPAP